MQMIANEEHLMAWRRLFHQYPELSGQEQTTSMRVAQILEQLGYQVQTGVAGHGLVAVLPGDPQKQCYALRADMDALPIQEENQVDYCSQHNGVMHACGHDAHMAMVLGAAECLAANRPDGTVKLIFQPREEKPPGGAKDMIRAGVLQNPHVDGIIATHITNALPCGVIGVSDQVVMALADDFHLSILGKGAHGADPHRSLDTVLITAQVIQALQQIVSRRVDPAQAAVISIGTIHGGTAQNIIPDRVDLTGTLRCLDAGLRDRMLEMMHQTLAGVTGAWGASYELNYIYGYPPVKNSAAVNRFLLQAVESLQNKMPIRTQVMEHSMMAGEDFAYYGQRAPSAFFFTGSGNAQCQAAWHTNCFEIDEHALVFGASVMAHAVWLACMQLRTNV